MPIRRNLDDAARPDPAHRPHPVARLLAAVRLDPLVAPVGRPVGLQVVVHERVVVLDAERLQLRDQLPARQPRRRRVAARLLAREGGQHVDGFGQDVVLLLGGQVAGVSGGARGRFLLERCPR